MPNTRLISLLIFFFFLLGCERSTTTAPKTENDSKENKELTNKKTTNKVVTTAEINWEKLNPARGDQSPQAATIWGDRHGEEPTGFLVKFIDGFSSPPHIHNVTYRGVVIDGLVHNDNPKSKKMWMPAGSFWTQPAGEAHITAAFGAENIAYIEIDNGPYLVKPTKEAFKNGEKPINVDKSNVVWLDASRTRIIESNQDMKNGGGAEVSFLWGKFSKGELNGSFVKIPMNFKGEIISSGKIFHAVVIEGAVNYKMPQEDNMLSLMPGSYFSSEGKSTHAISSNSEKESTIYIRTNGEFKIIED